MGAFAAARHPAAASSIDYAGSRRARQPWLTVGASEVADKGTYDYVCDGVDDQVEINEALLRATRPGDGLGGQGWIGVALVGSQFYVANNDKDSIYLPPATILTGQAWGTLITPMWSSNVDRGAIELLNNHTGHVTIASLSIGGKDAVQVNGHGILFIQDGQGTGQGEEIYTAHDAHHVLYNTRTLFTRQTGANFRGVNGGSRGITIYGCEFWHAAKECIFIDGTSDAKVSDSIAGGAGSSVGTAAFVLGGGNTALDNCKVYYSEGDGFQISSSRAQLSNCLAQDNGAYGFNCTGTDIQLSGCAADSNQRNDASRGVNTGGIRIAGTGSYDLSCYDRNQSPSSRQTRPIVIDGSPQILLTARTSVPNPPGTQVIGTAGQNSFVRVVRVGDSLYTVGR